jgi:hypothetical protein
VSDLTSLPDEQRLTEARARVAQLGVELEQLARELARLRARLSRRRPETLEALERQQETERLKLEALSAKALALAFARLEPGDPPQAVIQFERLKLAVVHYCEIAKVDPELWKNIAS